MFSLIILYSTVIDHCLLQWYEQKTKLIHTSFYDRSYAVPLDPIYFANYKLLELIKFPSHLKRTLILLHTHVKVDILSGHNLIGI